MRLNREDALRYLRMQDAGADQRAALEETAALLEESVAPRYVYKVFDVAMISGGAYLPQANLLLPGKMASGMLKECRRAALLLCTLGAAFDAMMRAWEQRDMARAVMLDACGSAYVEAGCDAAEAEIASRHPGKYLSDRFSPGYGDLPLALQDDFLRALDGGRRLGVQAAESHLLIPVKSVTAVIGLADAPQKARIRGCGFCALRDTCALRGRGVRCDF